MECARLRAAQNELQAWIIRRERVWRQKARSYGFSLKDHNTKFFHASTIPRRKRNEITHLQIDGRLVSGVDNLKREINRYFEDRFSLDSIPELEFDLNNHAVINEDRSHFLEALPSREEVKQAVWACGGRQSTGV